MCCSAVDILVCLCITARLPLRPQSTMVEWCGAPRRFIRFEKSSASNGRVLPPYLDCRHKIIPKDLLNYCIHQSVVFGVCVCASVSE